MGDSDSNSHSHWAQRAASTSAPLSQPFGGEGETGSTSGGFTSSLSSFNLRSRPGAVPFPSNPSTSNPLDIPPLTPLEGYPLFANRRVSPTNSASTAPAPFSTLAYRKLSMLGAEPIFPRTTSPSPPLDRDEDALAPMSRDDSDSPMVLGSPSFEQTGLSFPPPSLPFASRSRAASESMGSNSGAPASPVALARALQGQRTPPPFLQRRLYHEMQEDDSNGNDSARSGSASSGGARADDEATEDFGGLGLAPGDKGGDGATGSASGSGEEGGRSGVVRRAVSRKPNLLPKSKSHLRVLSQLQSESGPADLAEVMSEAALHRLTVASSVPPVRSTPSSSTNPISTCPLPSDGRLARSAPLGNRFPEQVNDDEMDRVPSPASSAEDGDEIGEAGSDWGGMSLGGYGTEDEDERRSAIWTGIRGSGSTTGISIPPPNNMSTGRSPGSERGKMDTEVPNNSPQTPGWHSQGSARPGKRKINDDRFEPYASAFKRRAVSPAALSPGGIPSPLLSFTHSSTLPTPPPLPSFPSSSLTTLPISIPSPSISATASHMHASSFFNTLNQGPRSRASSPVPSSLSSSAGRGAAGQAFVGMVMSGRLERESEERNGRMGDAGDGLRQMSLG